MTSHAGSSQTNISAPLNRVEEHSNYLPEDAGQRISKLIGKKSFGR